MDEPTYTPDPRRMARARRDRSPHFVYELYDARGNALYVGVTHNLGSRLNSHQAKYWWAHVESVLVQRFPDKAEGATFEHERIVELQPLHNIQATEVGNAAIRAEWETRRARRA